MKLDLIINQIKASEYYSGLFDERFTKITQKQQMGICITYWNSEEKRVEVRYYEIDFMGHPIAKDIQHSFKSFISTEIR